MPTKQAFAAYGLKTSFAKACFVSIHVLAYYKLKCLFANALKTSLREWAKIVIFEYIVFWSYNISVIVLRGRDLILMGLKDDEKLI